MIAMLAGIGLTAQTTHNLNWNMNATTTPVDLTIDVGDTVIWTNDDTVIHTVTADAGSTESFDSGTLNPGDTFSVTFTMEGSNPYHCIPHPGMTGTITVTPLGVDEKSIRSFTISPNPASSELFIELPNAVENLKVRVFDITGKMIYTGEIGSLRSTINISKWGNGIYMLELTNGNVSKTKRFIKK